MSVTIWWFLLNFHLNFEPNMWVLVKEDRSLMLKISSCLQGKPKQQHICFPSTGVKTKTQRMFSFFPPAYKQICPNPWSEWQLNPKLLFAWRSFPLTRWLLPRNIIHDLKCVFYSRMSKRREGAEEEVRRTLNCHLHVVHRLTPLQTSSLRLTSSYESHQQWRNFTSKNKQLNTFPNLLFYDCFVDGIKFNSKQLKKTTSVTISSPLIMGLNFTII